MTPRKPTSARRKMKPVKAWGVINLREYGTIYAYKTLTAARNSLRLMASPNWRIARVQIQELSPKKRGKAK